MTTEKKPVRIRRAPDASRVYFCNRCEKRLENPVEKTALYIWDGTQPLLVCGDCLKPSDQYIWGDSAYLRSEEEN